MLKRVSLLLLMVFMVSACAKKNSEFAARYAKNKMGASVADGVKTQEAGEMAAAYGLEADVVDIRRYFVPVGQPGPRVVMSKILINDQEIPVTTSHNGTEIVDGKVNVGNYLVVFHAMCGTVDCNPYYASLTIYQNNQMLIQEGVRKYFDKFKPEHTDVYQWFKPQEARPLLGRDMNDVSGMVGFLNTFAESNSYSGNGLVK